MLGRIFSIMGVKNEELGEAVKAWKARCVFQGSNIRETIGTSVAYLFEETRNAPVSFAAARAALGVAALKGYHASLREAETVYLQAVIDTPLRTQTFVELLGELWPASWFKGGAKRQIPKYD